MMFWRLLARLLNGNRSRLLIALLAVVSGAAVISALLNVELDARKKLTEEFRTLGANLVLEPESHAAARSTGAPLLDESEVLRNVSQLAPDAAFAPYLYTVGRTISGAPVVVAGTWLDRMPQLAPWWKFEGVPVTSRGDETRCLVGKTAARNLRVAPGSELVLRSQNREVHLRVAAMIEAGGTEDNQVIVNLPVAQRLAGTPGKIQLVEISIAGTPEQFSSVPKRLAAALPGLSVRPIGRIAEAEGRLVFRIQLLVFSMVALILVLTALCVLATMAALAMERREDVGLMKAIGGSIHRVMGLFLAEIGVIGAAGGALGYGAGMLLAVWMGKRVFGAAISPRIEILPLTLALMVGVALAGALPLRLLGRVKPAVILRGER